jgi:hypothetical protein
MINVLISPVAPPSTQPRDFRWTTPGELVMVGLMSCDNPDSCGCGRSFSGLDSHKGTTVAVVAQRALTSDDLVAMAGAYCRACGWDESAVEGFEQMMLATLAIAADQPVGAELRIGRDSRGDVTVHALAPVGA